MVGSYPNSKSETLDDVRNEFGVFKFEMNMMCDGLKEHFMVEVEILQREAKVTRDGLMNLFNDWERTSTELILGSIMSLLLSNGVRRMKTELKDIL